MTPEEVGFAGAAQIGKLRTRARLPGPLGMENDEYTAGHARARLPPQVERDALSDHQHEQRTARRPGAAQCETRLLGNRISPHYRLDGTLDEDESRVRRGSAAHILGRCRRLVVVCAWAWLRTARGINKNCRMSACDFQDHLTTHGLACAFAMVTGTTRPRGSQIRKNGPRSRLPFIFCVRNPSPLWLTPLFFSFHEHSRVSGQGPL